MARRFRQSATIRIDATPDVVAGVLRDAGGRSRWMPEVDVRDPIARPLAAGDRVLGTSRVFLHRFSGRGEIVAVSDEMLAEDVLVGVGLNVRWHLSPDGNTTVCTETMHVDVPAGPLAPLVSLVLRLRVRLLQRETLRRLKRAVERSEVAPREPIAARTLPAGCPRVTPHMVVTDVESAVEFLRAAFGATGEVADGRPAEVRIGDSMVMVSAGGRGREVFPVSLHVQVDDADAAYDRAIAAGAETLDPPRDAPNGSRWAIVRDRSGNVYEIAHRLR